MDNNRKLHVGLIQMKCEQDKAKNVEKAVAYIHEAVSRNAQIICLQELFNTQYFCFSCHRGPKRAGMDNFDVPSPIVECRSIRYRIT